MSFISSRTLTAAVVTAIFPLLSIEAAHAQEAPLIDATVTSTNINPQNGEVTISGTVTCSEKTTASISAEVSQVVGRTETVRGWGYTSPVPCDTEPQPFSLTLAASEGRFAPGKAKLDLWATACNYYYCNSDNVKQSIRLQPAH